MRLDIYLVTNKNIESRNKAAFLIKSGLVFVNGTKTLVSSQNINDKDIVTVKEKENYVSIGAYKLIKALDAFKINLEDKVVLDIGCSTGGFSQVCLERKCKKVYGIDVGTSQTHHSLLENPKFICYENTHFNKISESFFNDKIDFFVCDVSFISLTKVLEHLLKNFKQLEGIFLIKPQFELDKNIIKHNKGFVKDKKLRDIAVNKIKAFCLENKIKVINIEETDLFEKNKNIEYLIYLKK